MASKNIICIVTYKYIDLVIFPLFGQFLFTLKKFLFFVQVNEHIENDCKSDLAKRRRSGKCNVKGCKKREVCCSSK